MLSLKESLAVLKRTNALLDGHFVLSSGLHSPKYIQCAKLLSFPNEAKNLCLSLSKKIKNNIKNIDLILAPAMGGIIIGYEIGRILNKETIFCERVDGKFKLRRGFEIKKKSRIIIIEDVITTGKSSLECSKLIKKHNGKLVGYACIIDRSNKKTLRIKNKKIISQIKINIPSYTSKEIPDNLKKIPISKPGSRHLK
ncbi:MAG: orotate phosphoribosyltransferase [Candidatus Pelagibacter sp.]